MMMLGDLLPDVRMTPFQAELVINNLVLDSRVLGEGDAFVAIPGETTDGRQYVQQALDKGVVAVLAEAEGLDQSDDERLVAIKGLQGRLGALAACFHGTRQAEMLIAGVTGTNGKTSVAWYLRDALVALGLPCALVGTLGMTFKGQHLRNDRTTPDVLSLHDGLRQFREAGATACAMEVSSHALVQERTAGVPIRIAVFTNLSRDHLDYHGSMEAYFAAKAQLFQRPDLQTAIINIDDEAGRALIDKVNNKAQLVTYGRHEAASVQLLDSNPHKGGMEARLKLAGDIRQVDLPFYGNFNLSNILAVSAVLQSLQYSADDILQALSGLTPVPGRMQPVAATSGPRVLIDYAHTPDGLAKALEAVHQHFLGDVWCVVGCGGERDVGKRPLMASVAEKQADHVMLTSDNPRHEDPESILNDMAKGLADESQVLRQQNRVEAIKTVISHAANDDLVLIAGKGHEAWQDVGDKKIPMDDLQLAAAALASRQAAGGGKCS